MAINSIVKNLGLFPEKDEIKRIKAETANFISKIEEQIKKQGIAAEVFVGGSFAKNTIVKRDKFDVDIFVRFGWKHENLSADLEKIIKGAFGKIGYEKVHGSRDYFRISGISGNEKIIFEIVPVLKISNPKQARNVTDLSYFHVNYIKRKLNSEKLRREAIAAKAFCRAQNVYGAENYIRGFSGYGIECLIAHYKTLEKMLKTLSKIKEREIIDPEKKYKRKSDVLIEMNESRLSSPIILADPTWKERNVLAALGKETFKKFQDAALKFLKKPSADFFAQKIIDEGQFRGEAKKKNAEFVHLELVTGRQAGDIAGSKLKKFSDFLVKELSGSFKIIINEFDYSDGKSADLYLVVKSKKEIVRIGPPLSLKQHADAFRRVNKNVFERSGILYSKTKIDYSARQFINKLKNSMVKKLKEMSILDLRIL